MNITRKDIDALNAVVTVEVSKGDYAQNVEKVLSNYRKNAAIPGFRKGAVPMSLIQKQYGKAVMYEEVNKILQEKLNQYLQDEKLEILGNPMPAVSDDFNWDADELSFDFELGLVPQFSVDLQSKKVTQYKIVPSQKMIDDQVMRIRKQYGKMSAADKVSKESDITGTFENAEAGINHKTTISLDIFKDKKVADSFVGKSAGDVVTVKTKGLFDDDHKLMDVMNVSHDNVHGLDVEVKFTIESITDTEPANLDQELFDKLFGAGVITSEDELKARIKADAENQFAQQADQKFLNDMIEELIANTQFDLPASFLKKWMRTAGEKELSEAEAEEEYTRSENGLRYQLIESKIITENNLNLNFEDLKAHTATMIRAQMAQFGQLNPTDEDVEGIVARVLSNQDEVRRLSEQLMSRKMLELFKEKSGAKTKELSYEDFVKEMYGE